MELFSNLTPYTTVLLEAAEEGVTSEHIFDLDANMLFSACILAINVLVLFIFLSYILFNPIRKVLTDRQERITKEREEAEKNKEDALQLKAEYEEHLKQADKESEVILSEARKKALKNEEKIVEQAREEASRIIENAKREAELEKSKAADEVKKQIIEVSALLAQKYVSSSIDSGKQSELFDETLREIGDKTWQS